MENAQKTSFSQALLRASIPFPSSAIAPGYEIRRTGHCLDHIRLSADVAPDMIDVLYLFKHATAGAPEALTYRVVIRGKDDGTMDSLSQARLELEYASQHHLDNGILPGVQQFSPVEGPADSVREGRLER